MSGGQRGFARALLSLIDELRTVIKAFKGFFIFYFFISISLPFAPLQQGMSQNGQLFIFIFIFALKGIIFRWF